MADHDAAYYLEGMEKLSFREAMEIFSEYDDNRELCLLGMHVMLAKTQGLLRSLESDDDKATIGAIRDDLIELWDSVKANPVPLPSNAVIDLYTRLCEFSVAYGANKKQKREE